MTEPATETEQMQTYVVEGRELADDVHSFRTVRVSREYTATNEFGARILAQEDGIDPIFSVRLKED